MSRRSDRSQRRFVVVRRDRPPAAGRFGRRPSGLPRPGWRDRWPVHRLRPLPWYSPVAGRAAQAQGTPGRFRLLQRLRQRGRLAPGDPVARVLVTVLATAVFAGTTWLTTRSALLDVDHIVVRGDGVVTDSQAAHAAGIERGQPLLAVDADQAERRLEALPWVRSARVGRAFPNHVWIELSERSAAAVVARPAGGFFLLDRASRVLAERPDRPDGLPEVVGAGPVPAPGAWLKPARPALDVVRALPDDLRRQVVTAVLKAGSVTLRLGERDVRFGPATELEGKSAALSALLQRLGSRSVAFVDIRVPSAPVVGPPAQPVAAPLRVATPAKPRTSTSTTIPKKPQD